MSPDEDTRIGSFSVITREMKSVCVYCGSSEGRQPAYRETAQELGRLLAAEQCRLVYGGGRLGLMGVLAETVHANGGRSLGIIPRALDEVSGGHVAGGDWLLVESMHERKQAMQSHGPEPLKIVMTIAEAFIALPGGFGTLEELVECITWAQLRIHNKPIGLVNVAGYFNGFIQWMDHAVQEGFIDVASRATVVVGQSMAEVWARLKSYRDPPPPTVYARLSADSWTKGAKHPSAVVTANIEI